MVKFQYKCINIQYCIFRTLWSQLYVQFWTAIHWIDGSYVSSALLVFLYQLRNPISSVNSFLPTKTTKILGQESLLTAKKHWVRKASDAAVQPITSFYLWTGWCLRRLSCWRILLFVEVRCVNTGWWRSAMRLDIYLEHTKRENDIKECISTSNYPHIQYEHKEIHFDNYLTPLLYTQV